LHRECRFIKSLRFQDEEEFRIIYELPMFDNKSGVVPMTVSIDIELDTIRSVAICKENQMETLTEMLLNYIGFTYCQNNSIIDPLKIYTIN